MCVNEYSGEKNNGQATYCERASKSENRETADLRNFGDPSLFTNQASEAVLVVSGLTGTHAEPHFLQGIARLWTPYSPCPRFDLLWRSTDPKSASTRSTHSSFSSRRSIFIGHHRPHISRSFKRVVSRKSSKARLRVSTAHLRMRPKRFSRKPLGTEAGSHSMLRWL